MRITVLDGSMNGWSDDFSVYTKALTIKLGESHIVDYYHLSSMNLQYCTGCWSCWWKTPGICAINDDAPAILASVMASDFLIFASPLIAGFTSSALKKINDRFVLLLHPYFQIVKGEMQHRKRYNRYPSFGLLIKKEADTDDEDLEIVEDLYRRFALNFHSDLKFIKFTEEDTIDEICNEISHF